MTVYAVVIKRTGKLLALYENEGDAKDHAEGLNSLYERTKTYQHIKIVVEPITVRGARLQPL